MVAVARTCLMALWRFRATGGLPVGAVRKAGEALGRCGVTPRSGGWWRRPEPRPGRRSTPASSGGRRLWACPLSSQDAERRG